MIRTNRLHFAFVLACVLSSVALAQRGGEVVAIDESKFRRGDPNYERPKMESAKVFLYPQGFHPKEVTFTAGLVNMHVHNRSGVEDLPLILERKSDSPRPQDVLRSERTGKDSQKWYGDAELPQGEYRLRVEDRPLWSLDVHVLAEPQIKR